MHFAEEVRCRELVDLITEYLEDGLGPADRLRFEQHLSRCDNCDKYLTEMRKTLAVAGGLSAEDLTPPARQALLAAFSNWSRQAEA